MPCPRPAVPSPTAALPGCCPLSSAGVQSTQLLVEPPWTPAVLWDRVTLSCQGSGTRDATTWYKDGRLWWHEGPDHFLITESGTYTCDSSGTGLSPPVSVLNDRLVLQVPARALLEGDTVTLRCRRLRNMPVTGVRFYREGEDVGGALSERGTELFLPPRQLHHGGRYSCGGWVSSGLSPWAESAGLGDTSSFPVPVLEAPPELTEGSPLNLSCLSPPSPLRPRAPSCTSSTGTGGCWGPAGVPAPGARRGVSDSGDYSCEVRSEWGDVRKSSARLRVTVRRVPLSEVSLSAQPPGGRVALGDRLVLSCSVAAGTGPLSFSWHRGGSGAPLGTGPRLELRHVRDNDSGHYQCRASDGDSAAESAPVNVTVLGEGTFGLGVAPPTVESHRDPVRSRDPRGGGGPPFVPGGGTGGVTPHHQGLQELQGGR
uniref:Ig-like domain-containing protein n=1 Tax=Malurus cyaneus samueli TaxID=2593467 RepID=A0A8C5X620_9PASS